MKIIHTSMLLPIILGGCSLPHRQPASSDALQFVDVQIQTNTQVILLAQEALKQASAMTQRSRSPTPISSFGIKSSAAPLNSAQDNPSSIRGLKNVKSLGTPGAFTLVKRSTHNQSINAVLRQIIPQGWSIEYSADLKGISQQRIDFEANDQWPFVLDRFLIQHQLVALINWPTQRVSIAHWTAAFNPALLAKTDNKSTPTKSSSPVSPGPRNPFSASRQATESTALPRGKRTTPSATPVSSITPAIKPVIKTVAKPKNWQAEKGSTLKDTLFLWAVGEKCAVPGISNWTIAWLTSVNYRIDAPLQFEGDFRDALNSLFTLYGAAKVPLYAGVRQPQCVISVDDKEVR
ncbi:toxin co-regulated pilus biosynthesis Q family protein [Yersinia ruckeri]|nr:toxin co-regulated pilus biosynthesis Q family protein [Yersinia ruckeri]EKN4184016.1 toxin co-regulated pilus biosynthesis Q family protein [Yersinia ruckeri]EKN4692902.1 toxin co-regulated pilus biosynthesis Q family protein [Yersinia ruckeri]EKN4696461.1 toxin co-regulated pilus biosynthesis Q family protein [Yersinia ruckeri]MCK8596313.1 toxin co-regulated pilus biosynthesis Q family protein [Yersinia ruckeri]MCK8599569.1 toxin co-regulated pilus biosynthesis Q family protein [Yersinia 